MCCQLDVEWSVDWTYLIHGVNYQVFELAHRGDIQIFKQVGIRNYLGAH